MPSRAQLSRHAVSTISSVILSAECIVGNVGGLFNQILVTVGQMNTEDFGNWFVNTLWRLPKKV